MSTGFGSFRNSNFLTSHERVVNSYISVFMYIHLLCFAADSYQKSKPGNEKRKAQVSGSYCVTKHRRKPSHSRTKRKSLMIIRIQEALRRKLNNLKPLYLATIKSIAFQKRSTEIL